MLPAELVTERLVLRRFRADDVDAALAFRDDARYSLYLPHIPRPFTRADAEAFVATNMSEPWDRFPTYAVTLGGSLIGTVNFSIEDTDAMLGYTIGRLWWGHGYAAEAARAALDAAIATCGLTRIWAATDARNMRSQRVLEKLGMVQVGTRDEVRDRDGSVVHELVYAVDVDR